MRTTSALAALGLATLGTAQMTTTITTPTRIGATMNVRYASTPGDGCLMFLSAPSAASIPVPGIGNTLLLDPITLTVLYATSVGGGGTVDVGVPVPKDPSLIGASIELQPLNIGAGFVLDFGVNDVLVTLGHTGRAVIFQGGSIATTTGNLDVQRLTNNNVGNPASPVFCKSPPRPLPRPPAPYHLAGRPRPF